MGKRRESMRDRLQLDSGRLLHVWCSTAEAVEAFAMEELLLGLRKLGLSARKHRACRARRHEIAMGLSSKVASLASPGAPIGAQGYRVDAAPGDIVIRGGDGAGLLYGVYGLLEALGVRYVAPGGDGIAVVTGGGGPGGSLPLTGQWQFEYRCMMFTGGFSGATTEECLTFLARSRVNKILMMNLGLDTPAFRRACDRRGIACEVGGHYFNELLPRRQFERHPEYFRSVPGGLAAPRTPDHNGCSSGAGTRKIIAANARLFARRHARAVGFHWWPDDIQGGGWCNCPTCKHLDPADQSLQTANAAARALRTAGQHISVAFLAYHDTAVSPATVEPDPNVFLLYAPRDRCYAHGLGDPQCPRNVQRNEQFRRQLDIFGRHPFTGPFDYYIDGILFRNFVPPMLQVMAEDFRHYRRLGLRELTSHFGSTRELAAVELINVIAFGRLAYDARLEPQDVLRGYADSFGSEAQAVMNLFKRWETVLRPALAVCCYDVSDKGDYLWPTGATGPAARAYAQALARAARAAAALPAAARKLERSAADPAARKRLAEFAELLELVAAEMQTWMHQVRGQNLRMACLNRPNRRRLREASSVLRRGARNALSCGRRFAPPARSDRKEYLATQNFVANELLYLAQWCDRKADSLEPLPVAT
ncbi:MAG: DUF4838 domain-containing protein [Planctomycetes bacterium]|nr:DUF4838 domain-containing protein [Planctomycetota bacterium]